MSLKWQNFVILRRFKGLGLIVFSDVFTYFALLGSSPGLVLVRQELNLLSLFPFWSMLQQDKYWERAMNSRQLHQDVVANPAATPISLQTADQGGLQSIPCEYLA